MELSCPSCGAKHDTDQYKGEFEIDCACGYSILIPDEENIASESEIDAGFSAPPSAMDAEDASLAIQMEELENPGGQTQVSEEFPDFEGAGNLTPEEELPEGMLYDPDEAQSLAESKSWEENNEEEAGQSFQDPFETEEAEHEEQETSSEEPLSENSEVIAPEHDEKKETISQNISQKNHFASVGKLIGKNIDVDLSPNSDETCLKLCAKIEDVLKQNPWVGGLVEKNKSDLSADNILKNKKITNIPEFLALEIFLYCYEIGGTCSIQEL